MGCSDMEQDIVKLNKLKHPIVIVAKHNDNLNHLRHIYVRDSVNMFRDLYGSAIIDSYEVGDTLK